MGCGLGGVGYPRIGLVLPPLATSGTPECSSGETVADAVVCLSRDFKEQTNPETCVEIPSKVAENVLLVSTVVGGVTIPEGQGSNDKTFKCT
ncbi:hypothetical protein PIB30_027757 [Stylosanthes scabra]|uniref:Uncharacterized protein n=1 Tax=Stylosanthes scabra TaxID=79078 RepID=A0ABU6YBA6_9FABA|nr:hypothetical protein [Stylosanthes scabra]